MKMQKQLKAPPTQRTPEKQAENKQLQRFNRDETKSKVLAIYSAAGDLNSVLAELGNDILPRFLQGTKEEQKEIRKTLDEKVMSIFYGFETNTQFGLMEGFDERFRSGAKEVCRQLITDLDCKTDAEKLMAETAAIAFMRYLDASRRLNNCLGVNEYLSQVKTSYMAMLSKERDRSHRQYLSTMATIRQLKAPTIEMNIKTNTAFVSQNQQFNAPKSSNENNEPK